MLSPPTFNPLAPTRKTRMASSTFPLLSSNPSSILLPNPHTPAFPRSLRRSQSSVSSISMPRFGVSFCSNARNVCPWPSETLRRCKDISFQKHGFGSQQRYRWKLHCVKSGEMEESSSDEVILLDESTLQQDLEKAIEEENYSLAAKIRDDLRLLQDDNKASVLAANAQFYKAFKNGDFVAMRSIWTKGDNACIVHPGAGAISGYDLVMGSWEIICGVEHEFPIMIELKNVEVHVRGDVGYVTCLEVVKTKGNSWGRQVATNVFERVDGKWLMCVHHASHVDM